MKALTPVVVVGGTVNALGVVRSLALGRVPIFLLVTSRWHAAAWSRFCHVVRAPSLHGHELVAALTRLSARTGQRPVLLLTEDRDVEVVSTFREELDQHFQFGLPSKEMVHTLADKTLFQKFAEKEGFPVPRAIVLADAEDLRLLQTVAPPFVIKPNNFQMAAIGCVKRAVLVHTLEEARTVATEMIEGVGSIVVQEWVDGADSDIYFTLFTCDSNSNVRALFSGRKLTCYPPEVGSTAVCARADEAEDELADLSRQFVDRVSYRGVGSLEFKRDRRTGKFVIIEPTVGRTDWQEEIATLCGVNIPLIAYWSQLEHTFEHVPGQRPLVAWRSSIRHRPPVGALSSETRIVDGYFRLNDPLPAVYHYAVEKLVQPLFQRTNGGASALASRESYSAASTLKSSQK